jgi:hypothetical protein
MPNISDFASKFKGGVRPNLFRVNIVGPVWFDDLDFLCKATTIPASTIGKIEVPYRGRKLQVPGDRTFEDWTVTILNDVNWQNRSGIEMWMNMLQSHTSNYSEFDPDDRAEYGLATVSQLDRQNNILRSYRMEVLPISAAAITLDADTTDAVQEFETTFAVNYVLIDSMGMDASTDGGGVDIRLGGRIKIGGASVGINL